MTFVLPILTGVCWWLAAIVVATASDEDFSPRVVIHREFPAIRNPKVVAAAEAGDEIRNSELVLGVTVGNASRAYPINMLTGPQREIINDKLGGLPIAATW